MTKLIHSSAKIETGVSLGNNVVIAAEVKIGCNCDIGNNVTIHPGSIIGNNVRIDDNAVIGKLPMRAAASANPEAKELLPARIGDGCIIGTNAVIYRGCEVGSECLVADLATIRENVVVGSKTIIGRNVAIENDCQIGFRCKLETNCYITAYSTLGNHVFIAPGVITSNDNYAGRGSKRFDTFRGVIVENGGRIGANATILPGKTIGRQAMAGAGSVITRDVPQQKLTLGNPARIVRDISGEQLLSEAELSEE